MNPLSIKSLKLSLLAATAGVFASTAHAAAPDVSPSAPPIVIAAEVAPPPPAPEAAEQGATSAVKAAGLAALLAGALALGIRLLGRKRIEAAVAFARPVVERVFAAPVAAVRSLGRSIGAAAATPIRLVAAAAAMAILALTGIDVFNIDWAIGLASGAALLFFAIFGFGRTRKGLVKRDHG